MGQVCAGVDACAERFYVGEFHMKYLAHKKMDFHGWNEGQRIRFFQALSPVMDRYILKPIGAVLAHQQFTSLLATYRDCGAIHTWSASNMPFDGPFKQQPIFTQMKKLRSFTMSNQIIQNYG